MTTENLSEVGLLARMSETAAARLLIDARLAHPLLKDAAKELRTSYQTVLKWEKRLAATKLVTPEYPSQIALPNGKKVPKKATYDEALQLVLDYHRDPQQTKQSPPPTSAAVAKLIEQWLAAQAELRSEGDATGARTLAELGSQVGVDKFYLSRLAHRKIKKPNPTRMRRIAEYLTNQGVTS